MDKDIYKALIAERIEKNYSTYEKYFEFDKSPTELNLLLLNSLTNVIFQNLHNLILENYVSSILVTSHLLEKFCKLAIVQSQIVGLNLLDKKFNDAIENAYDFDDKNLGDTINKLKSLKLISHEEKLILIELKNKMRNIFFHSNTLKITEEYPNKVQGFHFNIKNPVISETQYLDLNTKTSFLKNEQIELEAKKKAFTFFKQLYPIIVNVDRNLQKQHKFKTSS